MMLLQETADGMLYMALAPRHKRAQTKTLEQQIRKCYIQHQAGN